MSDEREQRSEAIYLRLTPSELARLDVKAEELPFLSRSGLARECIRLGLDRLDAEGSAALTTKPKRRRRKR